VHAAENEDVEIFFRPEHADVVEVGQGHFKTTVVASFFMGDHTRLILDWTGSDYLTIEAKGNQSFKKGQKIDIRIDPAALITLKV
jgi:putative spermidine/putrescine transport system ATP-binding protein